MAASSVIMLVINISSSLIEINYISCKGKKNTRLGLSGPYNGDLIFFLIFFYDVKYWTCSAEHTVPRSSCECNVRCRK